MAPEWVINGYNGYPGLVLQDCEPGTAGPAKSGCGSRPLPSTGATWT